MEPEELLRRLMLLSALGLILSVAGLLLIVFSDQPLLGAALLIPGLILVSLYRVGKVLHLRFEAKIP